VSAGDLVWVDLSPTRGNEQSGRRPCLVVSDAFARMPLVVPLTHTSRGWPTHVQLEETPGDGTPSVAMCEQLRAVSSERIVGFAGRVSRSELAQVRRVLAHLLEID
jgi:mRNA interferase MazF